MNELSLHILDICQNSIKANATLIEIKIEEDTISNEFRISIKDNGHGMNAKTLSGVADPFYTTRTTRKVGLGISLFKMAAEMAGGSLEISSKINQGTTVIATFLHNHIDRAPLGDITETLIILILNDIGVDILYSHHFNGKEYIFSTKEVKEVLNGIPLTESGVILWIKNNIEDGITTIYKEEAKWNL